MKRPRLTKEEADWAEDAAIRAGYEPKKARAIGCRLLRDPRILGRIAYLAQHPEELTENPGTN